MRILITSFLAIVWCYPTHSIANPFSADTARYIANTIATQHYLHPPFDTVYQHTHNQTALNRYLTTLDKYSHYYSAEYIRFANKRNQKKRIGIGMDLLINGNTVLAVPFANAPLFRAGMTKPAYIHSLNNKVINYDDLSTYQFLGDLRAGQSVTIKTKEIGTTYKAHATYINNKTLHYQRIHQHGVITLRKFTEANVLSLKKALAKTKRVPVIVIDLRHNPGGDVYATTDMLSFFLKKNQDIAYLKRGEQRISLQSLQGRIVRNKRIIILTSRFTASSAEVFIHALKHYYPKLTLIGDKTAGKCLAQEDFPLKNNALLHLSVYTLLTPTSQSCQGIPIIPDRMIKNIELMSINDIVSSL